MQNRNLNDIFAELQHDLPHLVRGMQPLAMGKCAIALSDGMTVRKIVFHDAFSESPLSPVLQVERETSVMNGLAGQDIGGIEVPRIIDPLRTLDHEKFAASYTMTKISGYSLPIEPTDQSPNLYAERYKSAGKLMAVFHEKAAPIDLGTAMLSGKKEGLAIVPVKEFDDAINTRLTAANRFLQAHTKSGNIHGDFHMGNILGHGGYATGLTDFSHAGHAKNMMTEFWALRKPYAEFAIQGYEEQSGRSIRPLVIATDLSLWSEILADDTLPADHAYKTTARTNILGDLDAFEQSLDL